MEITLNLGDKKILTVIRERASQSESASLDIDLQEIAQLMPDITVNRLVDGLFNLMKIGSWRGGTSVLIRFEVQPPTAGAAATKCYLTLATPFHHEVMVYSVRAKLLGAMLRQHLMLHAYNGEAQIQLAQVAKWACMDPFPNGRTERQIIELLRLACIETDLRKLVKGWRAQNGVVIFETVSAPQGVTLH